MGSAAAPRFLVSLDFELMWGVRETRTVSSYGSNILGGREAIPRLLALFGEYGVKATWATVGMVLFAGKKDLLEALPELRPTYHDRGLDPYGSLDTLGENEGSDPFHFGLSLAQRIAECDGMELASHTFSHYFALEPGQTEEQFAADLDASVRASERVSGRPTSIVFPRNQVNPRYLAAAARRGSRHSAVPKAVGSIGRWPAGTTPPRGGRRGSPTRTSVSPGATPTHPAASARARRRAVQPFPAARTRPAPRQARVAALRRITSAMEAAARGEHDVPPLVAPHNFGAHTAKNLDVLEDVLRTFQALNESTAW